MLPCTSHFRITAHFALRHLASRTLADAIFDRIAEHHFCEHIQVDFAGIETISRAFADQFYKLQQEALAQSRTIEPIGTNDEIASLLQAVGQTQGAFGRNYQTVPVYQFNNRKDLKAFLFDA